MLDKTAMRFQARVMTLAQERFGASCEGRDAEPFLEQVYRDYVAAGSPERLEEWIERRLQGVFLSIGDPPRWVEDEPAWPFFEGRPMVFVSQTSLKKNIITEKDLTWDEEVYLFGIRIPLSKGYRVEYRVVTQHPGIDGTGLR